MYTDTEKLLGVRLCGAWITTLMGNKSVDHTIKNQIGSGITPGEVNESWYELARELLVPAAIQKI